MNSIAQCLEIEAAEDKELEMALRLERAWVWIVDCKDEMDSILNRHKHDYRANLRYSELENDLIYARRAYRKYRRQWAEFAS